MIFNKQDPQPRTTVSRQKFSQSLCWFKCLFGVWSNHKRKQRAWSSIRNSDGSRSHHSTTPFPPLFARRLRACAIERYDISSHSKCLQHVHSPTVQDARISAWNWHCCQMPPQSRKCHLHCVFHQKGYLRDKLLSELLSHHPSTKLVATVTVSSSWRRLRDMAGALDSGPKENCCMQFFFQRTELPMH